VSQLRHIETASRQPALIQSIIDDLERTVQILHADIQTEEERARVFDRANPLYPILARTLLVRLENLRETIADLKNRLISFHPSEDVRKAA
jgi:methyl coenzyme M reductase beta subunit